MKVKVILVLAVLLTALVALGASRPLRMQPALNVSLVPVGEVDLIPLVLSTNDTEVSFATASNFVQTLEGAPLILLVKADGDFYEGQSTTDATKNVQREAHAWHALPVAERTSWHFRAAVAGTTIKGKVLLGS